LLGKGERGKGKGKRKKGKGVRSRRRGEWEMGTWKLERD